MKIAVVGAGVSGLAAIRYALQYGVECVAFEITESVGGTWVYYEDVSNELKDQIPIAMYYNLRTNLPTCLMEFRGYKFQPKSGRCFPHRSEVLNYIEDFARDYNLTPCMKFSHKVTNISQRNDKWTVTARNIKTNGEIQETFDAVMVCSGRYSVPNYPNYPGMDTFPGYSIHSCYYKKKDRYKNEIVLLIGRGPSALDIAHEIAEVATKVIISYGRKPLNIRPKNIIQKPRTLKIDKNLVHFEDNTIESVDAIIYCTGYKYEFPFLDPSCEITNENMVLSPLYKNFVNAKHPTMCINGLLQRTIVFPLLDLQAEVFIKIITGRVKLPSEDEMLSDIRKEYNQKMKSNMAGSHFYHLYSRGMREYLNDLCEYGQCEPFPPVLFDIHDKSFETLVNNFDILRNQIYEVINNSEFALRWDVENSR